MFSTLRAKRWVKDRTFKQIKFLRPVRDGHILAVNYLLKQIMLGWLKYFCLLYTGWMPRWQQGNTVEASKHTVAHLQTRTTAYASTQESFESLAVLQLFLKPIYIDPNSRR